MLQKMIGVVKLLLILYVNVLLFYFLMKLMYTFLFLHFLYFLELLFCNIKDNNKNYIVMIFSLLLPDIKLSEIQKIKKERKKKNKSY